MYCHILKKKDLQNQRNRLYKIQNYHARAACWAVTCGVANGVCGECEIYACFELATMLAAADWGRERWKRTEGGTCWKNSNFKKKMGSSAHKHPYRKWSRWSTKIRARRMWCTLEKVYKLRHIQAQFCGLWWYMQALYIILIFLLPKREKMQKDKKCRTVHARGPWMHMFAPTVSRSIYNNQTVLAKSQQRAVK